MTTNFDNDEIYNVETGETIADLDICLNCKHRKIEECFCDTDRGTQDLSYPVCELNQCIREEY